MEERCVLTGADMAERRVFFFFFFGHKTALIPGFLLWSADEFVSGFGVCEWREISFFPLHQLLFWEILFGRVAN